MVSWWCYRSFLLVYRHYYVLHTPTLGVSINSCDAEFVLLYSNNVLTLLEVGGIYPAKDFKAWAELAGLASFCLDIAILKQQLKDQNLIKECFRAYKIRWKIRNLCHGGLQRRKCIWWSCSWSLITRVIFQHRGFSRPKVGGYTLLFTKHKKLRDNFTVSPKFGHSNDTWIPTRAQGVTLNLWGFTQFLRPEILPSFPCPCLGWTRLSVSHLTRTPKHHWSLRRMHRSD